MRVSKEKITSVSYISLYINKGNEFIVYLFISRYLSSKHTGLKSTLGHCACLYTLYVHDPVFLWTVYADIKGIKRKHLPYIFLFVLSCKRQIGLVSF